MKQGFSILALFAALSFLSPVSAQEGTPTPAPAASESDAERTETRLRALEYEVQRLQIRLAEAEKDATARKDAPQGPVTLGMQLLIRFDYFVLNHSRKSDVFAAGNDEKDGFGAGVELRYPLWTDIFKNVDLVGFLDVTYRQSVHSPNSTAPITGAENSSSWANVIAGPMLMFKLNKMFRPFVLAGFNLQVQSPPTDGITYLDAGITYGAGLDVLVHEKISVGFDLRYTHIGAADQENSDYFNTGIYIGFNF